MKFYSVVFSFYRGKQADCLHSKHCLHRSSHCSAPCCEEVTEVHSWIHVWLFLSDCGWIWFGCSIPKICISMLFVLLYLPAGGWPCCSGCLAAWQTGSKTGWPICRAGMRLPSCSPCSTGSIYNKYTNSLLFPQTLAFSVTGDDRLYVFIICSIPRQLNPLNLGMLKQHSEGKNCKQHVCSGHLVTLLIKPAGGQMHL